ncbi:MAG: 50S ribosomal protein L1 [Planctomycetota bacterium]|nr:50S ribosomal protein L1 [Planctomycetota bacterium]
MWNLRVSKMKRSKRYKKCVEILGGEKVKLSVEEAVKKLKMLGTTKFDQTVDIVFVLGIDPRKGEQTIRGAFSFPRGIGRQMKVAVFAEGDAAEEARKAGADEVGGVELVEKVKNGWTDFDVALATPDMMRHVGKLGKVLGPIKKMPSTKTGTVTTKIGEAVREFKGGRLEYRNDATGNVHMPVGKLSMPEEHLIENVNAVIEHIKAQKPASVKGTYLKKVSLSATMSPSIELVV